MCSSLAQVWRIDRPIDAHFMTYDIISWMSHSTRSPNSGLERCNAAGADRASSREHALLLAAEDAQATSRVTLAADAMAQFGRRSRADR